MKISLNLAAVPSRHERYGLAWAMPLALLGTVALAFLSAFAVGNLREYRSVRKDISRLEERDRLLAQREDELRKVVNQPQFQAISREAQYVNSLIDAKKLSAADLTLKVSKLMPASVRLSELSLTSRDEPMVRFSIVGRDEGAVETFLAALEDSPDFKDVAIMNQGFQTEGANEGPVTIICTARYVGSVTR